MFKKYYIYTLLLTSTTELIYKYFLKLNIYLKSFYSERP